jgi:hypothetical protein
VRRLTATFPGDGPGALLTRDGAVSLILAANQDSLLGTNDIGVTWPNTAGCQAPVLASDERRSQRPPLGPFLWHSRRRSVRRGGTKSFSESNGSDGLPPARRGPRGHKRNSPATRLQLLPRLNQSTVLLRLHRSNRSVWSGFRPGTSECAWQQSLWAKPFNPRLPKQLITVASKGPVPSFWLLPARCGLTQWLAGPGRQRRPSRQRLAGVALVCVVSSLTSSLLLVCRVALFPNSDAIHKGRCGVRLS